MNQTEKIRPKKTIYSIVIKRALDIMLCTMAIFILIPVFGMVSVLAWLTQGSPIMYNTKRPGKDGKLFKIYKFRSMTNKRDSDGTLLPEHMRVTAFGRWIRKLSIDELPELFCILKGDMSIIGPRPLLLEYMDLYTPRQRCRQLVRPGLECPIVISEFGKNLCSNSWEEQFENDIYYIENVSFFLDVKMFFLLVYKLFRPNERRIAATREPFKGSCQSKGER